MSNIEIEPRWIGRGSERRFAVLTRPASAVERALLFAPPFAEEMNKSRRLVAQTARALATSGYAVLVPDLYGCGDSPGSLERASWSEWCDDLARTHAWLAELTGVTPGVWSLRAGALLVTSALPVIGRLPRWLLWQPTLSGKAHLSQFLRLKVAADALAGADASASTTALWSELEHTGVLDIAGYRLPSSVALPMSAVELRAPPAVDRVVWLEVNASGAPAPASERVIGVWRASGLPIDAAAVVGPPFWQTQELEDCPALIDATVSRALS